MTLTLHEWVCGKCGHTHYYRRRPPKPGALLFRAYLCPNCKAPMLSGTGKTIKAERKPRKAEY